jgi:hypothetical protein
MSQKAETKKETPERSSELDKLEIFTGKWHTTGKQLEGVVGPAADIDVRESYEWLDGKYFLVHHFKGDLGGNEAACIEMIGYDPETKKYSVNTFYNNGVAHKWTLTESIGTWVISGTWPMQGKEMKTRCTMDFSEDEKTLTSKWEMSENGNKWETFWKTTSTKA